jgi:hypothetical protein
MVIKMAKSKEISKNLSLSQQRKWQNWSTVDELASSWGVSKRRVQQILVNLGINVDRQHLITVEGTIETFVSVRPIFRLLR